MQHQRRQSEVIDQLSFVGAVSKVRNIFSVRHVGFGDEPHMRSRFIQYRPHKLDDCVCLRQVQASCSDFLPEKRDGIQPDEPRPACRVKQQHFQYGQQYAGIPVIQIHLVGAESRP